MRRLRLRWYIAGGTALALLLATFVAPNASSAPDGLERVAIDQGFDGTAEEHAVGDGPLADYGVRGLDGDVPVALSGSIGIGLTFAVGMGLVAAARKLRPRQPLEAAPGA